MYIWCDTVCFVSWLTTIKKAMCLRQFLMSRLQTDAIHITIYTSISFFSIYKIFLCIENLCLLASIAIAIIMCDDDDDECIHKTLCCMVETVWMWWIHIDLVKVEQNSVERFTLTKCNPFN